MNAETKGMSTTTTSILQVVGLRATKPLYLCPLSLLNKLSPSRKDKLLITKTCTELFEEDIDPTTDYFF